MWPFCKHEYVPITGDYALIGYHRCLKCGKEKYFGDNVSFTYTSSTDEEKAEIVELARFMHEEYENAARQFGWATQEVTRVAFKDLPPKNRQTMMLVALRVYKKYIL